MQTAYAKHKFRCYITNPGTISLYSLILLSTLSFQSIVLFRARLFSEYQVVGNQPTPLVIVEIVLDFVTPSLF